MSKKIVFLSFLFNASIVFAQWSPYAPTFAQPQVGQFCAPGFIFDSRNCFLMEAPQGTQAFIHHQNFYYTPLPGKKCVAPAVFDGANCFIRPVPAGYDAFKIGRKLYTGTNNHFIYKSEQCPPGLTYDGLNCLYATAPQGRHAVIENNHFAFGKGLFESCEKILPGSYKLNATHCGVRQIPVGHQGFTYQNRWYTQPTIGGLGQYFVKDYMTSPNSKATPVCLNDTSNTQWVLAWSDEFSPQPDGKKCYTSNDHLHCAYASDMTFKTCVDAPRNWRSWQVNLLPEHKKKKYAGLRELNKCHWTVFDAYNEWEISDLHVPENRSNNYIPDNITVKDGVLEMRTSYNVKRSYDCGKPTEPTLGNNRRYYTNECPFSGANLSTPTVKPWYSSHSEHHTDPAQRYVGKTIEAGRIEFRVNIKQLGHGAWPSVWLFVDSMDPGEEGFGELDNLEFIGDHEAGPDIFKPGAAAYGMAHQTIHNWGMPLINYPHVAAHKSIPIGLDEWHTYAIEFDDKEIRVYLDDCLTKRLVDGTPVPRPEGLPIPDDGNTQTIPFKLPGKQKYKIMIGNPASEAPWQPAWYRANGGPLSKIRKDFKPTIMQVDYVRYYKKKPIIRPKL